VVGPRRPGPAAAVAGRHPGVHLSGFTTQSPTGDLDRTPDQVARVSAQVIEAALAAALAQPG
jgi:hypothetical protein